ncbi:MAG TPA: nitronate monooxygenase, partial [Gemmataceae bacterium]|nr:nitronate monooxygenase [Gemmataceae bacterium]
MAASRGPRDSFSPAVHWVADDRRPATDPETIRSALADIRRPVVLVRTEVGMAVAESGSMTWGPGDGLPVLAVLPPNPPSCLGNPAFGTDHGLRFPYVTGAMANGIASADLVEAIGTAGMLAFFGAAGLSLDRIESAIVRIKQNLGDRPFGFNLIHSPGEQTHESATVDLYLRHGVRLAEASAFLDLTPHVVRYRLTGICRGDDGTVVTPNRVIAKVSRVEVAARFLSPPPAAMMRELISRGELTQEQAKLAEQIPMAQDLTAEADSAGHTDN